MDALKMLDKLIEDMEEKPDTILYPLKETKFMLVKVVDGKCRPGPIIDFEKDRFFEFW